MHSQVSTTDVEALVDRMGRYLVEYETQLSTVVAKERYRQSETQFRSASLRGTVGNPIIRTRTLESEVASLRLPGNAEWFGVRHVLSVDRREIDGDAQRLSETIASGGTDQTARIRAIVLASSRHNLGAARTINMPTVPLELLHPKHRQRFAFTLGGTTTIARIRVQELRYRELYEPSLIRDAQSSAMLAHGSVWLAADGRVVRVTLHLAHARRAVVNGKTGGNELRVDFAVDRALGILVPRELREEFELPGGGRFQGRATYSQLRRFTTSAKVIAPP